MKINFLNWQQFLITYILITYILLRKKLEKMRYIFQFHI